MKIKNKNFKTIEEQIDLLKTRSLSIKNYEQLKYYLKWYNYQNFISGYNDPFMKNFQRINNKYIKNATDLSIIELFNFDRSIGPLLLSNIQNIERRFSSSVAYEIAKELKNNSIDFGLVFKLNELSCTKIFKLKKINEELKEHLSFNFENNKSNLQNKYSCQNDKNTWILSVPIWTLSIFWSFGNTIYIFNNLNKNIKNSIIKSAFDDKFLNQDEFLKIMLMLKNIRNRICHNNVLYNVEIKNNENTFISFLKRHNKEYDSNKIRICDIVNIIDIILKKNNKENKNSLWNIFKEKIQSKIIKSNRLPDISKRFILKKMNFTK